MLPDNLCVENDNLSETANREAVQTWRGAEDDVKVQQERAALEVCRVVQDFDGLELGDET